LTKTHLFGLTQPSGGGKSSRSGMVRISVRHPLSTIIKIATKSSCPEIISFTYGEKITKKSNVAKKDEEDEEKANEAEDESNEKKETDEEPAVEYDIKGKDWFFIPDYAGEAASAVKMRILEIADLITN
jgi:hypothetical protein